MTLRPLPHPAPNTSPRPLPQEALARAQAEARTLSHQMDYLRELQVGKTVGLPGSVVGLPMGK